MNEITKRCLAGVIAWSLSMGVYAIPVCPSIKSGTVLTKHKSVIEIKPNNTRCWNVHRKWYPNCPCLPRK